MSAWTDLLQRGVDRGILPPAAGDARPPAAGHPWPLVLLSFLGAQLAALPFIAFVLMLFGSALERHIGPYVFGPLVVVAACVILRGRPIALFVENLALVALMAGLGLLYYGLLRDLHEPGYLVCAAIALALAVLVPVNWVRALLGATGAALCYGSFLDHFRLQQVWYIAAVQILAWAAGLWIQHRELNGGRRAAAAIALEWILLGWLLQALASLALFSGMTFLAGGVLGGSGGGELAWMAMHAAGWADRLHPPALLSVLLALAGGGWGLTRWPVLRSPAGVGLILVLAGLSWFMPALGPVLLAGVVTLVTGRPAQAGAAALAAAWIIGSFYYSLGWDLVTKAQVLVVAGLCLAALAWSARAPAPALRLPRPSSRSALALTALGALATLAVVNAGIWQKEDIIAHGRPVFIKLAPVDPRSLMQGDYMALNFEMAPEVQQALAGLSRLERQYGVARVDSRGVAKLFRLAGGEPPAPGEIRIELIPKNGRWIVVSDAWFFKEGEGQRWSRARYGEFRVLPDGKALLVGMADENLELLGP